MKRNHALEQITVQVWVPHLQERIITVSNSEKVSSLQAYFKEPKSFICKGIMLMSGMTFGFYNILDQDIIFAMDQCEKTIHKPTYPPGVFLYHSDRIFQKFIKSVHEVK